MTIDNEQIVTVRGTKEGLIFHLDDDCSFDVLYEALYSRIASTSKQEGNQSAPIILKLGYRYLHREQKQKLKQLIEQENQFKIERYDSQVVDKQEAEKWLEESSVKLMTQVVRSGQLLEVKGDLLLVGDVNPGAEVKASGNIYVLGQLNGIAHAGAYGNEAAVIAASYMNPMQLRIANYISRAPDYESEGVYMECGYLDKENQKIAIDRLQILPQMQRELRAMERRMNNG
ncbi:MAG TPA: septum site-determining protein MinC [Pseudogracilibacillus sp.]|nr:septum site-determining protein MinC [Pseudogracilibacillus sp.]